jgi:hypothetical protein
LFTSSHLSHPLLPIVLQLITEQTPPLTHIDTPLASPYITSNPIPHYTPFPHLSAYTIQATQAALRQKTWEDKASFPLVPEDYRQYVIDTGVSITIMNSFDAFASTVHPMTPSEVSGIGSGLSIEGIGTTLFDFTPMMALSKMFGYHIVFMCQHAPCVYFARDT